MCKINAKTFLFNILIFFHSVSIGQEITFSEAINSLKQEGYFEQLMLKKRIMPIGTRVLSDFYAFPIKVNKDLTKKLPGTEWHAEGTEMNHIIHYPMEFSTALNYEKKVILHDYKDTIETKHLQHFVSEEFAFAKNYNYSNQTAECWYSLIRDKTEQIFGTSEYSIFGMTNNLSISFSNKKTLDYWIKSLESNAKYIKYESGNDSGEYHYSFQDIQIELVLNHNEEYYSLNFTLPLKHVSQ